MRSSLRYGKYIKLDISIYWWNHGTACSTSDNGIISLKLSVNGLHRSGATAIFHLKIIIPFHLSIVSVSDKSWIVSLHCHDTPLFH